MTNANKFKMLFLIGLTAILLLGAAGCIDDDRNTNNTTTPSAPESVSVKGSDTVLPLAQSEAETYMEKYSGRTVSVTGGGSGVGITALIDGTTDIAMASRSIKSSEIENAKAKGINTKEHIIAWDGIVVIVNKENPVSSLTYEQLNAIYSGKISNWKDVGGEDRTIAVMTRDSSSGTYEYFKEEILEGGDYRPDALAQATTGGIVKEVQRNKGAIGYIGFAYLDDTTKGLALDKEGNGNAVEPKESNILAQKYPLARELFFYTDSNKQNQAVDNFINFVLSSEGKEIITEVGYFPNN
ncbi:MAG: PstS family phosphate ABC transporter substrate-binding protein [Methanosarcinaceae archaeon]|nr:PstS family phosphate ABC transporter substrate-binding protein [Methanosarcinaceae archaeon]